MRNWPRDLLHSAGQRTAQATQGGSWVTERQQGGNEFSRPRAPRRFADRQALHDFAEEFRALGGPDARVSVRSGPAGHTAYPAGMMSNLVDTVLMQPEADLAQLNLQVEGGEANGYGYWGRTAVLSVTFGWAGTRLSNSNIGPEGIRLIQALIEKHTVPYTRRERKSRLPAVEDVSRAGAQSQRRTSEIEHSAGRRGAVLGALSGGVVSAALLVLERLLL